MPWLTFVDLTIRNALLNHIAKVRSVVMIWMCCLLASIVPSIWICTIRFWLFKKPKQNKTQRSVNEVINVSLQCDFQYRRRIRIIHDVAKCVFFFASYDLLIYGDTIIVLLCVELFSWLLLVLLCVCVVSVCIFSLILLSHKYNLRM